MVLVWELKRPEKSDPASFAEATATCEVHQSAHVYAPKAPSVFAGNGRRDSFVYLFPDDFEGPGWNESFRCSSVPEIELQREEVPQEVPEVSVRAKVRVYPTGGLRRPENTNQFTVPVAEATPVRRSEAVRTGVVRFTPAPGSTIRTVPT
jgi:hypothetical protein